MKRKNWPVEEYSIRPAGPSDACFYCGAPKGSEHKPDCVIRERTVVIDVTIRMVVKEPESFTPENIEFRYNESSWCADNIIPMLESQAARRGCLCHDLSAKFVREATENDEKDYRVYIADSAS